MIASIDLPIFGKRGIGNDSGMAVARFKYTDKEGDEHDVIAICAYTITGVVAKTAGFEAGGDGALARQ